MAASSAQGVQTGQPMSHIECREPATQNGASRGGNSKHHKRTTHNLLRILEHPESTGDHGWKPSWILGRGVLGPRVHIRGDQEKVMRLRVNGHRASRCRHRAQDQPVDGPICAPTVPRFAAPRSSKPTPVSAVPCVSASPFYVRCAPNHTCCTYL